jgi:CubicO group peptidase (beta-lactamase class C family)
MHAYTSSGRAAGVVTLVALDGRVVHHAAHGVRDLATDEPLQPDAIFRIASQTPDTGPDAR